MKIYRKNDLGPLGAVESEQVQCMMGLEHVEVSEPGVLILSTGTTPMLGQITWGTAHMKSLGLPLSGSGTRHRFVGPSISWLLAPRQPGFCADHQAST